MYSWPLRAPNLLQSILWPIIHSILVTFGQISNFSDSNLVTFFLCICLISNEELSTSQLQCKHSGTFANRKYEELSCTKNQKMCDPILVILLKMRPHYSHQGRENSTPSSGRFLLVSYTEVPPPPGLKWQFSVKRFCPRQFSKSKTKTYK